MRNIFFILLTAIITENFVLVKFLGICPFLGVSNRLSSASGMGIAVTLVMLISTAITWPIQTFVLNTKYAYLQTVAFILVIAAVVQVLETVMKKMIPSLYTSLGVYLPLITTNCAVLGVTILNFDKNLSWGMSMINALGGGLGFLLAMVIFAGVRGRIDETSTPSKSFKGVPITLIAAAIISLAFTGFNGVIETIFG